MRRHCLSNVEVDELLERWGKNKKMHAIAWEVELVETLAKPFFLARTHQEVGVPQLCVLMSK